ncbi:MAG: hypothetical protein AAF802_01745 [Planctomycetota bacterium]
MVAEVQKLGKQLRTAELEIEELVSLRVQEISDEELEMLFEVADEHLLGGVFEIALNEETRREATLTA